MDCGRRLGPQTEGYGKLSDKKAGSSRLLGNWPMSNRYSPRICSLLVVLSLWGCSRQNDFEIVEGGGSTESDSFGFQAGGLFLKEGLPGVMFGTEKKPAGEREFVYLVIFKHQVSATSNFITRSNSLNATGGEKRLVTMTADLGLGIGGLGIGVQQADLKSVVEIETRTKTVKRETLTLNGKEVDLGRGRLFLADLAGTTKPKWEQVHAKLPANLPDPKETKGVRDLVRRVFDELPKESESVRDFLKRD
jgi:hypothetical protein